MNSKVYFLSGLGADSRTFSKLNLPFKDRIEHIEWIKPKSSDTIVSYAQKLIDHYAISEEDTLVGVSFGGMMAIEINALIQNKQTIIISSAASNKEISGFIRATVWMRMNRLIPKSKLNKPNPFVRHGFGAKSKEDKRSLDNVISNTDVDFAYWAFEQIGKWDRKERSKGVIKIHGDQDKIIKINNQSSDYTVKNGGHMMVMNMAEEISQILTDIID